METIFYSPGAVAQEEIVEEWNGNKRKCDGGYEIFSAIKCKTSGLPPKEVINLTFFDYLLKKMLYIYA